MQPLPFEIGDDRHSRIAADWEGIAVLVVAIALPVGLLWWNGYEFQQILALLAEESYLNPFSLMLGLALLAILWRLTRAFFTAFSLRRGGGATLEVKTGSRLRQGGRLVGAIRLGPMALARLDGHIPRVELVCEDVYAIEHTGEMQREPRLIAIESARVGSSDPARIDSGAFEFTLALPSGLKPLATFIERTDGPHLGGATFVTLPFMKPRLIGGENRKPRSRRWRVRVLGGGTLASFDLSAYVEGNSKLP
ncbi:hypothetical protein NP590_02515 [Methylomonas sp. SURF-2]|uniref:DUF4131 domain-containing protein n=1 Tax=Methylomonas subterranea TaxID=2952225 RepID=A0ABT1TBX8_9GAMM|nr:hypothetical protein [Methylomonas sp. SURF-2]MCQ8102967.1 hypothetical protein [Methylomonas sp. SURF-2]